MLLILSQAVLMNFSGSFNLSSGGFLTTLPLNSNCLLIREGHGGWSPTNEKQATERFLYPGAPQSPA